MGALDPARESGCLGLAPALAPPFRFGRLFGEVDRGLEQRRPGQASVLAVGHLEHAEKARDSHRQAADGGVVDYLEVLDSERSLFNAELAESSVRREALTAFVTLYKALGGGWSPPEKEVDIEVETSAESSPIRSDS